MKSSTDLIVVSPVGRIAEDITVAVARKVETVFRRNTRIQPLLTDIEFAYDVKRDQYFSTRVLEKLALSSPPECLKVVAVTRKDLFIPILTHVYGEAQLGGKAAVISTARLMTPLNPSEWRASLSGLPRKRSMSWAIPLICAIVKTLSASCTTAGKLRMWTGN